MFFSLQTSTHCYCTKDLPRFSAGENIFLLNFLDDVKPFYSSRHIFLKTNITCMTFSKCWFTIRTVDIAGEEISQHPSFKLHQTCIWFSDIIIFNLFFTFNENEKGRYLFCFLRWFMLMFGFGTIYICSKFYILNFAWPQKRPFGNVRWSKLHLKDMIGAL